MAQVDDVAAMIVEHFGRIDTFKLQKLVYYCQAWHLVWDDEPLFDDPIEAWAAGPVVRSLYSRHRGRYSVDSWPWGKPKHLRKNERKTVQLIIESYGKLTGRRLSQLTHNEDPWRSARNGLAPTASSSREIPLTVMKAYYSVIDQEDDAELVTSLADDA
jgi:uncharacterized phage-associated protein